MAIEPVSGGAAEFVMYDQGERRVMDSLDPAGLAACPECQQEAALFQGSNGPARCESCWTLTAEEFGRRQGYKEAPVDPGLPYKSSPN